MSDDEARPFCYLRDQHDRETCQYIVNLTRHLTKTHLKNDKPYSQRLEMSAALFQCFLDYFTEHPPGSEEAPIVEKEIPPAKMDTGQGQLL